MSNDPVMPAKTVTHPEPSAIDLSASLLNQLAEHFVIACECPECERTNYYMAYPGHNITANCKTPTCDVQLKIVG